MCPHPDGHERLARAVQMLLDRARLVSSERATEPVDGEANENAATRAAKERP
jgi:hypothetical protein